MESFGNDMFLPQEGYASIDFTLLDRPSTSVASAPESTAPLLPDSSFPSFDFLDGSGMGSFGVLRNAEAQFDAHGRPDVTRDFDWRNDKSFSTNSNLYRQELGYDNTQAQLPASISGNKADRGNNFLGELPQRHQLEKGNWPNFNGNIWHADNRSVQSGHLHSMMQNSRAEITQHDNGINPSRTTSGIVSSPKGSGNNAMTLQPRLSTVMLDSSYDRSSTSHSGVNWSSSGVAGAIDPNHPTIRNLVVADAHGSSHSEGSRGSKNEANGVENEAEFDLAFRRSHLPLPVQSHPIAQQLYQKHSINLQSKQNAHQDQYSQQQHLQQEQSRLLDQQTKEPQVLQLDHHMRHLQNLHFHQEANQQQQQPSQCNENLRPQQSSQFHQQTGQPQLSDFDQNLRQQQTLQVGQLPRQQSLQFNQQPRQHQIERQSMRFNHQDNQQQSSQIEQHSRQQQALMMLQARMQQVHQARQQQQQAHQLEQQARLLQSQQLGPQTQHLDIVRQQQVRFLEHLAWQQQMQQFLANGKQNQFNCLPSSPYVSAAPDMSNMMHPENISSATGVENQSSSLMYSQLQRLNVPRANQTSNSVSSLPGLPNVPLMSQDANIARHAMPFKNTQQNPLTFSSLASNMRVPTGQIQSFYSDSEASHGLFTSGTKITPLANQEAFSRDIIQPSQPLQAFSNLNQGNSIPRYSQQRQIGCNGGELGQTHSTSREAPSHTVIKPAASCESGLYNSQQSGWHSVQSSEVVISSDLGTHNLNAGPFMHAGAYQRGTSDFLDTGTVKQHGSWSALMQSAVAESPSGDLDQDDWNSLNLQKIEALPCDSLQQAIQPQKNVWMEQNAPFTDFSNRSSLHLLKDTSSPHNVSASAEKLQPPESELGNATIPHNENDSLLESQTGNPFALNNENPQENNHGGLHKANSSHSLKTTSGQSDGFEDQTLSRSECHLASSNFAIQHQSTWRNHTHKQLSSDGRRSSGSVNFDCIQQNMKQKHKDVMSGNKGYGYMSVTLEDECQESGEHQKGQRSQQGNLDLSRCNKNANASMMENNDVMHSQLPECNDDARCLNNASLDAYAQGTSVKNALADRVSPQASDTHDELPKERKERSQIIYSKDDWITPRGGNFQPNAKPGSSHMEDSPHYEVNSQISGNRNHMSPVEKNIDHGESSAIPTQRMGHRSFSQPATDGTKLNQWHVPEMAMPESSRKKMVNMEFQAQQCSDESDFSQQSVAKFGVMNGPLNAGRESLKSVVETNLGHRHLKNLTLPLVSSSVTAANLYNITHGLNKQNSTSSQNVLNLLNKTENFGKFGLLKDAVYSEQKISDDHCDSSSSDVSLAVSSHKQPSSHNSPQVFPLRLGPPVQRVQRVQGQFFQTSETSHALQSTSDVALEENAVKNSLAIHQKQPTNVNDVHFSGGDQNPFESKAAKPLKGHVDMRSSILKEGATDETENVSKLSSPDIFEPNSQYVKHSKSMGLVMSTSELAISNIAKQSLSRKHNNLSLDQSQGGQSLSGLGHLRTSYSPNIDSMDNCSEKGPKSQNGFDPSSSRFTWKSDLLDPHMQDKIVNINKLMPENFKFSSQIDSEQGLQNASNHANQISSSFMTSEKHVPSNSIDNCNTNWGDQQGVPTNPGTQGPSSLESSRQPSKEMASSSMQNHFPGLASQTKQRLAGQSIKPIEQTGVPLMPNSQEPQFATDQTYAGSLRKSCSDRFVVGEGSFLQPSSMATLQSNPHMLMLQSQGYPRKPYMSNYCLKTSTTVPSPFNAGEQGKISSGLAIQGNHSSCPSTQQSDSCSEGPIESQTSEPSDVSHQQNVLAAKMRPMTSSENDPDGRSAKRMKTSNAGNVGLTYSLKENIYDRGNPQGRTSVSRMASHHISSAVGPNNNMETSVQSLSSNFQNRLESPSDNYALKASQLYSADERSIAISQYGNTRYLPFGPNADDKLVAMHLASIYNRLGQSGSQAVLPLQQLLSAKTVQPVVLDTLAMRSAQKEKSSLELKENEPFFVGNNQMSPSISTIEGQGEEHLHAEKTESIAASKQKNIMSAMIPWHVDISRGGINLLSTRDADLAWALSTNRLPEKEDEQNCIQEQGALSVTRSRKRLKLTSQLMQQLIPPLPRAIVNRKALEDYEIATYMLSRIALRDACALASVVKNDASKYISNPKMVDACVQPQKKMSKKSILQKAASFVERMTCLDLECSRLEASVSIADLKAATNDIERLSILSRLVKHHGRSLPQESSKILSEERESSSDSNCNRKFGLQRYVTPLPMPRNLPDGFQCISL